MGADKYNQPSEGAENWDDPINENFADLGIEVVGEVETFDDLPEPGSQSTNGEGQKILVRQSRIVYLDTGDGWEPIAGLGSANAPVPGVTYHEAHSTGIQVINGRELFIQDTEPADANEGDVWIDTSG